MNNIFNRIKIEFDEKGIPLYFLHILCDVSSSTASHWLNNRTQPNKQQFRRIADFLNVNQRELVQPTVPKKSPELEILKNEFRRFKEEGGSVYKNGKPTNEVLQRLRKVIEYYQSLGM